MISKRHAINFVADSLLGLLHLYELICVPPPPKKRCAQLLSPNISEYDFIWKLHVIYMLPS